MSDYLYNPSGWEYTYDYGYPTGSINSITALFSKLIRSNVFFKIEKSEDSSLLFKVVPVNNNHRFTFLIGNDGRIVLMDGKVMLKVLCNYYYDIEFISENLEIESNSFEAIDKDKLRMANLISLVKLFKLINDEGMICYNSRDKDIIFKIKKSEKSRNYLSIKHGIFDNYTISNNDRDFYSLFELLDKYNSLDKIMKSNLYNANAHYLDLPF